MPEPIDVHPKFTRILYKYSLMVAVEEHALSWK